MPGNKRNDKQTQADMTFIAEQMLKGETVRGIAKKLNEHNQTKGYTLAHSQIAYDIKKILNEYREERAEILDLYVDRELAKLDIIERECWIAWEKSKQGKRKTKMDGGSIQGSSVQGGKIKERSIEDSHGDVRFLDKVLDCMDRRANLLGLDAAKKVEFSGSVAVGTTYMDEQEMNNEKERVLKNLSMRKVG